MKEAQTTGARARARIAIIGSGPTGFYAAAHLLKENPACEVDIFDALPTPFGLVRGGVAPDHQKTKTVIKAYDKTALDPRCRFFGNVRIGADLTVAELRDFYHGIIYCVGAQSDRHMEIPGEGLAGSHTATEFVAWYNGHPEYQDRSFDLSAKGVVVVGVGNVAVDVARLLCRTEQELRTTDMTDRAIAALAASGVRDVHMLGRRGVAQAAFTQAEVKELGELADADVIARADEVKLDSLSEAEIKDDKVARAKVETVEEYARRASAGRTRRLHLRFLVSPVEILGDARGRVRAVRVVKNELVADSAGKIAARATARSEEIPAELVFRSVGYRGVALPGVPFDEKRAVIPNVKGRVLRAAGGERVRGEYAAGWIKRGPQGVIGTNKTDALETVQCFIEDFSKGDHLQPSRASAQAAEAFVRAKQPRYFSYADWQALDRLEVERGKALGRPRVKFTTIDEMLRATNKD